jgi:hypothetical protein
MHIVASAHTLTKLSEQITRPVNTILTNGDDLDWLRARVTARNVRSYASRKENDDVFAEKQSGQVRTP